MAEGVLDEGTRLRLLLDAAMAMVLDPDVKKPPKVSGPGAASEVQSTPFSPQRVEFHPPNRARGRTPAPPAPCRVTVPQHLSRLGLLRGQATH
jgi:hypothetical protein